MTKQKPQMVARKGVAARQQLLHTFTVDQVSEIDGQRYYGKFTTRKMSISDLAALGVRVTQLNGGFHHDPKKPGYGVDQGTHELNYMMAHLEIALVDYPEWWNPDTIVDIDLVGTVFEEVLAHENSFPRRARSAADGNSGSDGAEQGLSQGNDSGSPTGGTAREVVDEEVQAALEP